MKPTYVLNSAMFATALLTSTMLAGVPLINGDGALAATNEGIDELGQSETIVPTEVRTIARKAIQSEAFMTSSNQVLEVLLHDGTSLTLAAVTELTVDRYDYDTDSQKGELLINMEQGLLRVIGGKVSVGTPIIVDTPGGRIEIEEATVVIEVGPDGQTRVSLEHGKKATLIAADGLRYELVRPGFQVVVLADGGVQGPSRRDPKDVLADERAFNPTNVIVLAPATPEEGTSGEGDGELAGDPDGEPDDDNGITDPPPDDGGDVPELPPEDVDGDDLATPPGPTGPAFAAVTTLGGSSGFASDTVAVGHNTTNGTSGPGNAALLLSNDALSLGDDFQSATNIISVAPSGLSQSLDGAAENNPRSALGGDGLLFNFGQIRTDPVVPEESERRQDLFPIVFGITTSSDAIDGNISSNDNPAFVEVPTVLSADPDTIEVGRGIVIDDGFVFDLALLQGSSRDNDTPPEANIFSTIQEERSALDTPLFDFELASKTGGTPLAVDDQNISEVDTQSIPTHNRFLLSGITINGSSLIDDPDADNPATLDVTTGNNFTVFQAKPAWSSREGRAQLAEDLDLVEQRAAALLTDVFNGEDNSIQPTDQQQGAIQEEAGFLRAKVLLASLGIGVIENPDFTGFAGSAPFLFTLSRDDAKRLADSLEEALFMGDNAQVVSALNELDIDAIQREQILSQINRTDHLLFAAGAVDATTGSGGEKRIDTFFTSAGLDGFDDDGSIPTDKAIADGIRAFLRSDTAVDLSLIDSGVILAGTPIESTVGEADQQTSLLHADFGIGTTSDDGRVADQQSTISVTIGNVVYGENTADIGARTVGSTRETTRSASTLAGGDLGSSAVGAGAEAATGDGRVGYFVLENVTIESDEGLSDGTTETGGQTSVATADGREQPIGGETQDFAITRLGSAQTSTPVDPSTERNVEGLVGFVAGIEEQEGGEEGIAVAPVNLEITDMALNADNNRISVTLSDGTELGGISGEDTLGNSAYVDDQRFAARSSSEGSDLALVSGPTLQQAVNQTEATEAFLDVDAYETVKWGFFFGDTDITDGARRHLHLGSWVAGDPADPSEVDPLAEGFDPSRLPATGVAVYSGHAFGNVFDNGSLYSARGAYENEWDFSARAGSITLDFDGASLTGQSALETGTAAFSGSLSDSSVDRAADINGVFVGSVADSVPKGQIGTFSIEGSGNYSATGTFGAERD